jgi:hypothetical protein
MRANHIEFGIGLTRSLSVGVLLGASLLCGCAAGSKVYVKYADTSLMVDGIVFTRRTPAEIQLPGEILRGAVFVSEKPGQRAALDSRLNELGLTDRLRYDDISHYECLSVGKISGRVPYWLSPKSGTLGSVSESHAVNAPRKCSSLRPVHRRVYERPT